MVAARDSLEVVRKQQVQQHVPQLLGRGILDAVDEFLKEPGVRRDLCLPVWRQLLPCDDEIDQERNLEWSTGVVALTAAADAVREGTGHRVGLRQAVAGPAENLVYDLPLSRATHVRREQEVDAQDLRSQADHLRSSLANLILELDDEGPVALIGGGDECFVDLVQDVRAPDRCAVEQQGSIAQ